MDNDNTTLSSTHKILPPEFCLPDGSPFQAIADIALDKGSKEGMAIFEKVLNEYLSGIQGIVCTLMSVTSVSSLSLVLIRLRFRLETWLYLRNFLKFLT